MTTDYGIITFAEFEAFTGYDYSTYVSIAGTEVYSTSFVEAQISWAEGLIVGGADQTYDSTAPVRIKTMVKKLAEVRMINRMIRDGYIENEEKVDEMAYFDTMIKPFIAPEIKLGSIDGFTGVDDWNAG